MLEAFALEAARRAHAGLLGQKSCSWERVADNESSSRAAALRFVGVGGGVGASGNPKKAARLAKVPSRLNQPPQLAETVTPDNPRPIAC